jgi:predicted HTH domain antitoxin
MTELRVTLPNDVAENEGRLLLAMKLYEVGKLSVGQASKMAGLSKQAFMEMLGQYKVPVIAYSPEDLRKELQG